jgi:hypothetical protein
VGLAKTSKEEPGDHQEPNSILEDVLKELTLRESEGLKHVITILMNAAMKIEREHALYQHAREVFGDSATCLEFGFTYPVPIRMIRSYAYTPRGGSLHSVFWK